MKEMIKIFNKNKVAELESVRKSDKKRQTIFKTKKLSVQLSHDNGLKKLSSNHLFLKILQQIPFFKDINKDFTKDLISSNSISNNKMHNSENTNENDNINIINLYNELNLNHENSLDRNTEQSIYSENKTETKYTI